MKLHPRHLIFIGLFLLNSLQADITLAPIFSDNMVLQREAVIPLRGTATGEEEVLVCFNGKEYSSSVLDQRWEIELPPMPAGGTYEIIIRGGEDSLTLSNLTFGDIWLCAGQSNMDSSIETYKRKFPALYEGHPLTEHDQIRIFRAERMPVEEPQEYITREYRFKKGWYEIKPQTKTRLFSATGYFFGLYLAESIEVPIGLIQSCRGGTPITAWMPPGSLEKNPAFETIVDAYAQAVHEWPVNKIEYERQVKEWGKKKARGEKVSWKPEPPLGSPKSNKRPYALHNGMIAPLYQLPIKGVLWYQGEGNARTRESCVQYEALLKDMIHHWRHAWNNPNLPFLIVQLPGFGKAVPQPNMNHNWPWIRESQKKIEALDNCKSVCILDSGMEDDIHPPYKENVGKRLAYAARSLIYGQRNAPQSPEYSTHIFEGESTIITFKNVGSGLITDQTFANQASEKVSPILGFMVLDSDGKYQRVPAEIIAPDKVRLIHSGITQPESIRYGWENFPQVNLCGDAGMPVFPFRTDQFSPFTRQ